MTDIFTKLRILWVHFFLSAFEQWRAEVWRRDLDQNYCCNGHECGCQGISIRDMYTGSEP